MIIAHMHIGQWAKYRNKIYRIIGLTNEHRAHMVHLAESKETSWLPPGNFHSFYVGLEEIQQIWQE